jgi:protein-disulfide isomerase
MTSNTPRPTRSEQREAARAKAKAMREQQKKGDKRNRILIQLGIATSVLVATGAVVFAVYSASTQSQAIPVNATFNDGVKVGNELKLFTPTSTPPETEQPPVEIVIYVDYQCPICAIFEIPNNDQLRNFVESGAATLEVHALSFLDRASPNQFSSRAANAAYCVADYSPDSFFDYSARIFQSQPPEMTPGPENSDLIAFAEEVGASNIEQITTCIDTKEFKQFVEDSTTRALKDPIPGTDNKVTGTPAIFVNGQQYTYSTNDELASPARFAQFVQLVAAETVTQ